MRDYVPRRIFKLTMSLKIPEQRIKWSENSNRFPDWASHTDAATSPSSTQQSGLGADLEALATIHSIHANGLVGVYVWPPSVWCPLPLSPWGARDLDIVNAKKELSMLM